jgi:hypothetical protein
LILSDEAVESYENDRMGPLLIPTQGPTGQ